MTATSRSPAFSDQITQRRFQEDSDSNDSTNSVMNCHGVSGRRLDRACTITADGTRDLFEPCRTSDEGRADWPFGQYRSRDDQATGGIAGHSYALIADAIESFTDIFSSLIVWGGLRITAKPADEDYPYGYGKAEALAAAIVSLMLLGAALGIAVAAVGEMMTPHHTPAPFTLAVIAVVIPVKEILYRRVLRVGSETGSTAVKADAWHHRSDAITSSRRIDRNRRGTLGRSRLGNGRRLGCTAGVIRHRLERHSAAAPGDS